MVWFLFVHENVSFIQHPNLLKKQDIFNLITQVSSLNRLSRSFKRIASMAPDALSKISAVYHRFLGSMIKNSFQRINYVGLSKNYAFKKHLNWR